MKGLEKLEKELLVTINKIIDFSHKHEVYSEDTKNIRRVFNESSVILATFGKSQDKYNQAMKMLDKLNGRTDNE